MILWLYHFVDDSHTQTLTHLTTVKLNDPYYLGVQKPRLQGAAYYHLVDE
jgi:hypothetical protein